MRRITITLEVPDDVAVQVVGAPRDDEPLIPWDGVLGDAPELPFRTVATAQPVATAGVCPVHRVPWKVVPAGVSKKTGRSYGEFRACPTAGCDERPR